MYGSQFIRHLITFERYPDSDEPEFMLVREGSGKTGAPDPSWEHKILELRMMATRNGSGCIEKLITKDANTLSPCNALAD